MVTLLRKLRTDTIGEYSFVDLAPGQYTVCVESNQPDLRPLETSDIEIDGSRACTTCISLLENSNLTDIDFPLINAFVQVDVNVWFDNNSDGIINTDESFVEQAEVSLYDCNNNFIATDSTDAQGFVSFDSLTTNSYYVQLIAPNGETFSMLSDVTNSNGIGTTDCADVLPPGVTLNLGLVQQSNVGDYVWRI